MIHGGAVHVTVLINTTAINKILCEYLTAWGGDVFTNRTYFLMSKGSTCMANVLAQDNPFCRSEEYQMAQKLIHQYQSLLSHHSLLMVLSEHQLSVLTANY